MGLSRTMLLIFIFIMLYIFISKKDILQGNIIPWRKVKLTYKNSNQDIDSPEFYKEVMKKNSAGNCRALFVPRYKTFSDKELADALEKGKDADALMESIGRDYGNNYLGLAAAYAPPADKDYFKYYNEIRQNKKKRTITYDIFNIYTRQIGEPLDKINNLDRYAALSPYGQYAKVVRANLLYTDNKLSQSDYLLVVKKLYNAGDYYFGMALASIISLNETGTVDKDAFCEAYYNGCDLYKFKQKYRIKCMY